MRLGVVLLPVADRFCGHAKNLTHIFLLQPEYAPTTVCVPIHIIR
jgi:hypothetical protein